MEKLNKDELFALALHLDLPSLVNFCSSNKFIEKNLCLKDEIWIYKLRKDFPDFQKINGKSFRDLYKLLYSLTNLKEKLERRENIYELYNLQELYLDNKRLTEIPKEIGDLINLRELDLHNNYLNKYLKRLAN